MKIEFSNPNLLEPIVISDSLNLHEFNIFLGARKHDLQNNNISMLKIQNNFLQTFSKQIEQNNINFHVPSNSSTLYLKILKSSNNEFHSYNRQNTNLFDEQDI